MKKNLFIILSILFNISAFSLEHALYPEDGSMPVNYWYYSGGHSGPRVPQSIINNIEKAFLHEGVETVVFPKYAWIQDILFFDQAGNFVEMPNFPADEEYFGDVTMGIFESFGWGSGELTRISEAEFSIFPKKSVSLFHTFLEGGATITGKFADGSDYIIITESRFKAMNNAYRDMVNVLATESEILQAISSELKVKKENLIRLDSKIGSEHLDLYMKALPNGVLLLDDPASRLTIAKDVLKDTESEVLNNIISYEENSNYQYKKSFYQKKIGLVKKQLGKRFDIKMVAGRFFEYYTNVNGVTTAQEHINFFNGVSGINKRGLPFYITNEAVNAKALEVYWTNQLSKFGFIEEHIHFPGPYSNGSGLDCMGSPSI